MLTSDNFKIFLKFVEIQTKIASIFPMTAGILWAAYRYRSFNLLNTILFVLAVLLFDMCTTAINNTMDYFKAKSEEYKTNENVIGVHQLSTQRMVQIIWCLLGASIIISLILVALTDILLLFMGVICFIIGILYTFGPTPISRTPYGEVFSGFTMGFGIFFLAVFVQNPSLVVTSHWAMPMIDIHLNIAHILEILMMSMPFVLLIANIMLANNIRDLPMDIENERHTLVYYIGRQNGVILYQLLSLFPWILMLIFFLMGKFSWFTVIGFGAIYFHYLSVQRYRITYQEKRAFLEAIKSFVMFSSTYVIILFVSLLFSFFSK